MPSNINKINDATDNNLLKFIGDDQEKITETNAPTTVVFEVSEKLRGKTEYSVIRIRGRETTVLPDLDDVVNTVTIIYLCVNIQRKDKQPPTKR